MESVKETPSCPLSSFHIYSIALIWDLYRCLSIVNRRLEVRIGPVIGLRVFSTFQTRLKSTKIAHGFLTDPHGICDLLRRYDRPDTYLRSCDLVPLRQLYKISPFDFIKKERKNCPNSNQPKSTKPLVSKPTSATVRFARGCGQLLKKSVRLQTKPRPKPLYRRRSRLLTGLPAKVLSTKMPPHAASRG